MALTKKDIQTITEIVQGTETRLHREIKELAKSVESQFRIQNMVLDTRFRTIDSRFDRLEKRIEKGFESVGNHLKEHDEEITTLKDRVSNLDEQFPPLSQ